jgi:hypothetical protein
MRGQNGEILQRLGILFVALLAWPGVASSQHWLKAPRPPFVAGSIALQLTDGTIMVQEHATSYWWKLTPDRHADYSAGKWSRLARSRWHTPRGVLVDYAPDLFASAVLRDGRVIVEGGEYTWTKGTENKTFTNLGAIYDPVKNEWTPVKAPSGWKNIADAPSVVLPDGTFMLGNIFNKQTALLDAKKLTWTIVGGSGKFDNIWEEGWTLLPDGTVLTVDTYFNPDGTLENNSEIYHPGKDIETRWTSAGNTMKQLYSSSGNEIGPAILRPNGTVLATGARTGGGAGHTAIYDIESGVWTEGPDIPDGHDMYDAPAAILQDGNVLIQASPNFPTPASHFYEFDLKTDKFSEEITAPDGLKDGNVEYGRMLVVSSGHVFVMREGTREMWFYVPKGTYDPAWAPLVEPLVGEVCVGCVVTGHTYTISGTQFNGLSQGAAFGDDAQSATNYPLVLIENCKSGHKFFARTHDFSTMGVATGLFNVVTTKFTVSPSTEEGPSNLVVIANGIPSVPAGGSGCVVTVFGGGN